MIQEQQMSKEEIRKAQIQQQVEREHQELMKAAKQVCSIPDPTYTSPVNGLKMKRNEVILHYDLNSQFSVKFVSLSNCASEHTRFETESQEREDATSTAQDYHCHGRYNQIM